MHEGQAIPADLLTPEDVEQIRLHKRVLRRRTLQATGLGFAIGLCLVMFGVVRPSSALDSADSGDVALLELAVSGSDLDLLGNASAFLRVEGGGDVYWGGVERLAGIVLGDVVDLESGRRLRVAEGVLGVIEAAGDLASVRAKGMVVGLDALISLGAAGEVDGARAVALAEALASDLAWALELARTGSAEEFEECFEAYFTVAVASCDDHPVLWEGIEQVGEAVLDGRLVVSARRRRHISMMISGIVENRKSALLGDERGELARRLMAPYR